ncbi:histidine phosphatase family protein [Marinomonas sp. 15G1-11]|uniref:Histidine phosphatase family protein n=1 Tax=Marinomonas phaeophyticola TaxID=3004091 RepID=A0ABT4JWI2_9GAMM|nr:histidine phosphatase family protein [Marinomonas sp. 15G1-11]MCZ2722720.1 histidine phosphatase family protein [Marinomonas sp. 15G1-11]
MKLVLIRHPKPDVAVGTCYGRTDLDLPDGWSTQAGHVKSWLNKNLKGDVYFQHSPLKRAALLGQHLNTASTAEDELVELDFADWEGKLWKMIPQQEIQKWGENLEFNTPFNGESLMDVRSRLDTWWQRQKNCGLENLVVVTHSGVIKVLVSMLCNWPLNQAYTIDVGFCSVTELSVNGDYITLKRLGAGDWVV